MYAIIEVGAKQYNVKKDDVIEIEKMPVQAGKDLVLDKVLLLSKQNHVELGQPYVKDAKVTAVVLGQIRGAKKESFKYRHRKSWHWKKGHRQYLTRVKIKSID